MILFSGLCVCFYCFLFLFIGLMRNSIFVACFSTLFVLLFYSCSRTMETNENMLCSHYLEWKNHSMYVFTHFHLRVWGVNWTNLTKVPIRFRLYFDWHFVKHLAEAKHKKGELILRLRLLTLRWLLIIGHIFTKTCHHLRDKMAWLKIHKLWYKSMGTHWSKHKKINISHKSITRQKLKMKINNPTTNDGAKPTGIFHAVIAFRFWVLLKCTFSCDVWEATFVNRDLVCLCYWYKRLYVLGGHVLYLDTLLV